VFIPVVLAIGGSDTSAGAGIQADLKTIHAHGAYGATVITALTSQDTAGVHASFTTPSDVLEMQLRTVLADMHLGAIKVGMVPTAEAAMKIAAVLGDSERVPLVFDPVMGSSSGFVLSSREAILSACEALTPYATLLTPNIPEAESLLGRSIRDRAQATEAARELRARFGCAVLVKGGHLPAEQDPVDILSDSDGEYELQGFRLEVSHTHGTGCCLSSAIAVQLALGAQLRFAVKEAKAFVARALLYPVTTGGSPSAFDPFCGRLHEADSPDHDHQ